MSDLRSTRLPMKERLFKVGPSLALATICHLAAHPGPSMDYTAVS